MFDDLFPEKPNEQPMYNNAQPQQNVQSVQQQNYEQPQNNGYEQFGQQTYQQPGYQQPQQGYMQPNFQQPNNYQQQSAYQQQPMYQQQQQMTFASQPPAKNSIGQYKKHARSDINWIPLMVASGITMAIILCINFFSDLSSLIPNNTIQLIVSFIILLLSLFMTAGLSAGLINVFLTQKRQHEKVSIFSRFNRAFPMIALEILESLVFIPSIIGLIVCLIGVEQGNKTMQSVGALVSFILFIVGFIFYLRWVLAQYVCTEGKGPIQSMKASAQMMKGRKFQYIGMVLSFLGWIILGALFASIINLLIGTSPFMFASQLSQVGAVVAYKNMSLSLLIALLPTLVYMQMTIAEFYDDLNGTGLNPIIRTTSKKPMIFVGVTVLVLSLFSAASFLLPISKVSATEDIKVTWLGDEYVAGPQHIGTTASDETPTHSEIIPDNPIIDEPSTPDVPAVEPTNPETPATPAPSNNLDGGNDTLKDINYTIPSRYEYFDSSDTNVSYFTNDSESDSIFISCMQAYEGEFDYLISEYNAEKTSLNGLDAYKYTRDADTDYASYCYTFTKNGYTYNISGSNETDLNELIRTIK